MADDRKSTVAFTLEQEQLDFLKRYGEDVNRSQRVRLDLGLLQSLLDWAIKNMYSKISRQEATLLLDVLNGFVIDSISGVDAVSWPVLLSAEAEDGCILDQLDNKWGVDGKALVAKLANLTPLEALALFDFAGRFWSGEQHSIDDAVKPFRG